VYRRQHSQISVTPVTHHTQRKGEALQSPLEKHMQLYQEINRTLGDGGNVRECAIRVADALECDAHLPRRPEPFPAGLPKIMKEQADREAWKRFFPNDDAGWFADWVRNQRAAYALFRATTDASDDDAAMILFKSGAAVMSEVVRLGAKRSD
jgi:hypothetical protein